MNLQAHPCPNCGAPLRVDAQTSMTACVYCNSAVKITRDARGTEALTEDPELQPSQIETIKQLLFQGRRPDAVRAYSSFKPGASAAEVERAIAGYEDNISFEARSRATMSNQGWAITALSTVWLAGGVYLWVAVPDWRVVGVVVSVVAALLLLLATPVLVQTLRYTRAAVGKATVLHQTYVCARGSVHTFRMHLRVEPPSGPAFEVDVALAVANERRPKIVEGYQMMVKYFPGDPQSVLYSGEVDGS